MRHHAHKSLLILLGACCLYCANDALHDDEGGPVPDASGADESACCAPAPLEQPTVIFDGAIGDTTDPQLGCVGPAWDVSAFRTVVVHVIGNGSQYEDVLLQHGAAAGYVRVIHPNLGRPVANPGPGKVHVVDTRLGTSMRVYHGCGATNATVVGYVDR